MKWVQKEWVYTDSRSKMTQWNNLLDIFFPLIHLLMGQIELRISIYLLANWSTTEENTIDSSISPSADWKLFNLIWAGLY